MRIDDFLLFKQENQITKSEHMNQTTTWQTCKHGQIFILVNAGTTSLDSFNSVRTKYRELNTKVIN